MTEQEIKNLEMDLEECIREAIAMGASPDEYFAIKIIDKKLFYYHGSAIPKDFDSECFAYATIPDVEDFGEDNTIAYIASEIIKNTLGDKL